MINDEMLTHFRKHLLTPPVRVIQKLLSALENNADSAETAKAKTEANAILSRYYEDFDLGRGEAVLSEYAGTVDCLLDDLVELLRDARDKGVTSLTGVLSVLDSFCQRVMLHIPEEVFSDNATQEN